MNRLAISSVLPLAVAAVVLLWSASRKSRRYESDVYWRAVPLSRLKYLIAAQCLTGASLVFFFDLLRGGAGKRGDVVLLAAIAAPVFTALFLLRKRGTRRVAVAVTLAVLALFVAVPHIDIGHFDNSPQSTFGLMFDGTAMFLMMGFGIQAYRTHISTEGSRQLRAEAELALAHRLQRV